VVRMWRSLALLTIVLSVGCGDHATVAGAPGSTATPSPIPWISAPASFVPLATLTPEPMPTNVAACRAIDVVVSHVDAQPGLGWWGGGVRLMASGRRCLLHGYVELRFMDTAGREIVRSVPAAATDHRDWAVLGEAQVDWAWGNWCTAGLQLGSIVAILPGDPTPIIGRIDPPMAVGARCSVPNGPTIVSAGEVRPWPVPDVTVTARPAALSARIDAPSVAVAGEPLRFVVTLTNLTSGTLALDPCPSYIESLGGHALPTAPPPSNFPSFKIWDPIVRYEGGVKESHLLNCGDAPSLAPAASITFETRLEVPANALGSDTLRWQVIAVGGAPSATAPITIVRR
jgi:hypothetical protein